MGSRQLSAYTACVSTLGIVAVGYAMSRLPATAHPVQWLLFSLVVILTGRFAVQVGSIEATISASDTFFIAGALLFGPAPALITLAVDGLLLSRRKGHDWTHAVFNASAPALSLGAAAHAFYAFSDVPPLADARPPIAPLLLPLLLLTAIYFCLNSGLISVAVGLESGRAVHHIWWRHFARLSLSYLAAAAVALCLVVIIQEVGVLAALIALPILAQFYLTLRTSFARVEDAERHLREIEREVAERRRAEDLLRANERLNQTLVEHLPHRIHIKDPAGVVLFCNKRYAEDLGLTPQALIGRHLGAVRSGTETPSDVASDHQVVTAGALIDVEVPTMIAGQERWWHTVKVPFRDEHGAIIGIVVVSEDVTARRSLEMQYRQAQKMEAVGRLAGGIAHDFNNLLTAILGYCDLLRDETPPGVSRPDVEEIYKAGLSAAALTRQLLAFSRQQIIERTVLDPNAVITDMRGMLERVVGEDLQVVVKLAPRIGRILIDRGEFEQIVMNLVVNARDAMSTGGTLTIETAARTAYRGFPGEVAGDAAAGDAFGDHVLLRVADTGEGMTPEVQARVFEPFFTTKPAGRGTGLGLAMIHGIATRTGGSVAVSSEPGRGSTFTVTFPRAPDTETIAAEPAVSVSVPVRERTVLVVEDSAQIRDLITRMLQGRGYRALMASGSDEAEQLFEEGGRIDLLLTDVVMPGASGPELAHRLVGRQPGLKVVYMSGYTDDAIDQHGLLKRGVAFVQKPFTAETLDRKLREVLAR